MASAWDSTPIDPAVTPAPSGSAWDQTPSTPEPPKAKPKPVTMFSDPAEQYSPEALSALGVPVAGFTRGFADVGNTLLNAASHLAPKGSAFDRWNESRKQSLAGLDAEMKSDPLSSSSYQASRVGGNVLATAPVGGLVARAVSKVPYVSPALVASIESGGMTTGAPAAATFAGKAAAMGTRMLGGALNGGASTALISPENTGEGALIGALLPPAVAGAGATADLLKRGAKGSWQAAANMVRPFTDPEGVAAERISSLLGDDAANMAAILRNPDIHVPGSMPTAAQATADPKLLQLEKAVVNTPAGKAAYLERATDNNAARWNLLNQVSGTKDDVLRAVKERGDWAKPTIERLLQDPKTSAPVPAKNLFAELDKLEKSSLGTDPVVAKAVRDLRANLEKGVANTDVGSYTLTPSQWKSIKPDDPYIRPDLLDGYRRNVRTFLANNSSNGAVSTTQEAAFDPIKQQITDLIESANPGYKDYLRTYAQKSAPINTMESVQEMTGKLGRASAVPGGMPGITYPGYKGSFDAAIRNSEYGLTPDARKALDAIEADLQRETLSSSVRSPGSDTAYNLAMQNHQADKLLKPAATTAGALMGGSKGAAAGYFGAGKAVDAMSGRIQKAMAELLMNPQKLAASLPVTTASPNSFISQSDPGYLSREVLPQLLMRSAPAAFSAATR